MLLHSLHAIMNCFNGRSRFAHTEAVSRHLTLRNVNEEYRDSGGRCWTEASPAELSGSADQSYIPSLVKFDNIVGHVSSEDSWLWEVKEFGSPREMFERCAEMVGECVQEGSLWTIPNGRLYMRSEAGTWSSELGTLAEDANRLMETLRGLEFVPLSCASVHAAMEASTDAKCVYLASKYMAFPRDSTPSTGLYGTLHNNQLIDMSPLEEDKEPDMAARSFGDT
ncbi:hypothetical protein CH63R_14608 [Colletotrichum higginsianum IMI 349063]|uniref:Uncharacterized protein n=1 Tax=Colletotrichum higginsianum (strain IMI 349063) TaxID=759273 RepID=A0A1B7XQJ0_COLHI|nr:hypothetical protein CH63R_14608 [Colletotrichum higginsianum IMI 349063]OBR02036.1 hypothetical protein CH63R_14608 [Colletotrichum higginsianum IMI 349063]